MERCFEVRKNAAVYTFYIMIMRSLTRTDGSRCAIERTPAHDSARRYALSRDLPTLSFYSIRKFERFLYQNTPPHRASLAFTRHHHYPPPSATICNQIASRRASNQSLNHILLFHFFQFSNR